VVFIEPLLLSDAAEYLKVLILAVIAAAAAAIMTVVAV